MKKIILLIFIGLLFLGFSNVNNLTGIPGIAHAQEDWHKEFSAVCAHTQNAMTLSNDELQDFISRCDKLKERLGELQGSEKKIYTKRLQMCHDLYIFTLDYKNK